VKIIKTNMIKMKMKMIKFKTKMKMNRKFRFSVQRVIGAIHSLMGPILYLSQTSVLIIIIRAHKRIFKSQISA
jgi:hypothetical protein